MTSDRQVERPLPERLPLGAASRLLGVDPDTLRRWADEGRVPAFTTPGGHRRFERKALERLIAARRTGPDNGLALLGSNADRLSAAYRRRYSEQHGSGPDPRTRVPAADRDSFRELGRQLVDALVRHLDETGQARALAERDAIDLAAQFGERLALYGVTLADAVSMFVSARRPFLAELSVVARRRGLDAARIGDLFDASTWLLDRLLLAFVAGHEVVAREAAAARRRTAEAGTAPDPAGSAAGGDGGGTAPGGAPTHGSGNGSGSGIAPGGAPAHGSGGGSAHGGGTAPGSGTAPAGGPAHGSDGGSAHSDSAPAMRRP